MLDLPRTPDRPTRPQTGWNKKRTRSSPAPHSPYRANHSYGSSAIQSNIAGCSLLPPAVLHPQPSARKRHRSAPIVPTYSSFVQNTPAVYTLNAFTASAFLEDKMRMLSSKCEENAVDLTQWTMESRKGFSPSSASSGFISSPELPDSPMTVDMDESDDLHDGSDSESVQYILADKVSYKSFSASPPPISALPLSTGRPMLSSTPLIPSRLRTRADNSEGALQTSMKFNSSSRKPTESLRSKAASASTRRPAQGLGLMR